jgi:hypothetical protein
MRRSRMTYIRAAVWAPLQGKEQAADQRLARCIGQLGGALSKFG